MQYKQFILSSLCLLITLGLWYPTAYANNMVDNFVHVIEDDETYDIIEDDTDDIENTNETEIIKDIDDLDIEGIDGLTRDSIKELGPCDPSNLQPLATTSLELDKTEIWVGIPMLINPRGPQPHFRWCFSFTAVVTGTSGTLDVNQFVELWQPQSHYKSAKLLRVQVSPLPCEILEPPIPMGRQVPPSVPIGSEPDAGIRWNAENSSITFNGGYIECETLDLYETVKELSGGSFKICEKEPPCDLSTNAVNYIDFVPPSEDFPFWEGPLFKYDELLLSGQGEAVLEVDANDLGLDDLIDVNGRQRPRHNPLTFEETFYGVELSVDTNSFDTNVNARAVQQDFFLALEQLSNGFYATVNQVPTSSQAMNAAATNPRFGSNVQVTFPSESTIIYFGYDPSTETLGRGSLINGIFDPMCCGGGMK